MFSYYDINEPITTSDYNKTLIPKTQVRIYSHTRPYVYTHAYKHIILSCNRLYEVKFKGQSITYIRYDRHTHTHTHLHCKPVAIRPQRGKFKNVGKSNRI